MGRIKALDSMRGLTVAGMILVNNPGTWEYIYAPLRHAEFNGLTPTDLVFPFFVFIMGISTFISLRKSEFMLTGALLLKVVRRTLVLFLIGLVLNLVEGLMYHGDQWLSSLRYMGVMQRLALCYGATALIALTVSHRRFPVLILSTLCVYAIILLMGNGFVASPENIVAKVDSFLLGEQHLYQGDGWPFDPEGLLSTPAAIAHTMIGFCAGKILLSEVDKSRRMLTLLLVGSAMMAVAWLLSYGIPFNKKVWSPTFVLMTCGMAMTLLSMMIWIIDVKACRQTSFFDVFGANPLFIYVASMVMGIFSLSGYVYELCFASLTAELGSLCSAIVVVFLCWAIGYPLFKKHIYIKI